MSEPVQLQLVGASHNNQRLFSDHYLKDILPGQWGSLKDEAALMMAQLRAIYARFTPNSANEAQTEEDWIKPVLRALGHTFEVQAPLKVAQESVQRPDYIFYRSEAALALNKNRPLDAEALKHSAYAVGDAKSWDRPLDKALTGKGRGSDQFSNKNPSWQIFFYMLHSGLPWGILTNGRKWRLYSAQTALALFDEAFQQTTRGALDAIAAIEENPGVTIKDVKAQEAAYETLRQRFIEKYQRLANLSTALYYDLPASPDLWRPLADYALGTVEQPASPRFTEWSEAADAIAGRKHFFHWELEFPNIFFDSRGQPLGERAGFDVVISNPPYVRQEKLGPDKPFYQEHYEIYHGVADLFVYFFAQGLRLLRKDGRLAYISSNMWLRTNYATPLRRYLRTKTTVETIIDLGNTRIFADAPDLSPSIQIVRKTLPVNGYTAQVAIFGRGEEVASFREQLDSRLSPISMSDQLDEGWQLTGEASRAVFTKVMAAGKPLGEFTKKHMYYGVKTGLNDAFIIDQATRDRLVKDDPACAVIIKPMLRGEDLRPWYQENEGRWLIFTRRGIDINKYPAILAHLQQFREQLEPRPNDWDSQLLWPGRKPGSYKWYELQDTIDYFEEFEKPKIFWPDIARFPRFSWNEQGHFINDKGNILIPEDISLLGILQSRVYWFCITRLCAPLAERAGLIIYQHKIQFIERLPIPTLTDPQRAQIGTLAQQLTETARRRYEVRRRTTYRIAHDLGTAQARLNQRLTAWWELSFKEFRDELVKVFRRDIPLRERDDWEALLRERTGDIAALTSEIVRLETELNAAVYDVFGLNEEERGIIERETKYRYGEW